VKQFGRGIADKLKNAVSSDPDDNVELR
jgi:hypothetical protein